MGTSNITAKLTRLKEQSQFEREQWWTVVIYDSIICIIIVVECCCHFRNNFNMKMCIYLQRHLWVKHTFVSFYLFRLNWNNIQLLMILLCDYPLHIVCGKTPCMINAEFITAVPTNFLTLWPCILFCSHQVFLNALFNGPL